MNPAKNQLNRKSPQQDRQIGVMILAAGFSSRFGSDKRQVLLSSGASLLEEVIHARPIIDEEEFMDHYLFLKELSDTLTKGKAS